MKILLVANTGWYLYNFRLPLARFLRERGIETVMVSPRDAYVDRLQSEGFRWVDLRLNRHSINPLGELVTMYRLFRIYKRERPNAVHHFTIKCVLYGTLASKMSGTRGIVNAITGIGQVFVGSGWKASLVRPPVRWLYRRVLKARRVMSVVFQNPDDLQTFVDARLVAPERTVLIRSSGVDLMRFSPRPGAPDMPPSPVVLFASRITTAKGLHEYVDASRILKARGVTATFQIAGATEPRSPDAISQETLDVWRREGAVDLLGHAERVDDLIAQATVVVLPSYREGVPRILLEAAAMAKPIVATQVPGCREVVEDGLNGILVPPRDPLALANAIERLLNDRELCERMGAAGRAKMEAEFDVQHVIRQTADVYSAVLSA